MNPEETDKPEGAERRPRRLFEIQETPGTTEACPETLDVTPAEARELSKQDEIDVGTPPLTTSNEEIQFTLTKSEEGEGYHLVCDTSKCVTVGSDGRGYKRKDVKAGEVVEFSVFETGLAFYLQIPDLEQIARSEEVDYAAATIEIVPGASDDLIEWFEDERSNRHTSVADAFEFELSPHQIAALLDEPNEIPVGPNQILSTTPLDPRITTDIFTLVPAGDQFTLACHYGKAQVLIGGEDDPDTTVSEDISTVSRGEVIKVLVEETDRIYYIKIPTLELPAVPEEPAALTPDEEACQEAIAGLTGGKELHATLHYQAQFPLGRVGKAGICITVIGATEEQRKTIEMALQDFADTHCANPCMDGEPSLILRRGIRDQLSKTPLRPELLNALRKIYVFKEGDLKDAEGNAVAAFQINRDKHLAVSEALVPPAPAPPKQRWWHVRAPKAPKVDNPFLALLEEIHAAHKTGTVPESAVLRRPGS
ncbi:hypothetical protein OAO01_06370 [Oligoflexia bacterium]|nr:hypothetical protein [Oligoflexia bacterium]